MSENEQENAIETIDEQPEKRSGLLAVVCVKNTTIEIDGVKYSADSDPFEVDAETLAVSSFLREALE